MSKEEHKGIYYDPHNEIVCDKFALEKLIKENEANTKTIADLEAKLAESESKLTYKKKILEGLRTRCDSQHKRIIEISKDRVACGNAYNLLSKEYDQLKQQLNESKNKTNIQMIHLVIMELKQAKIEFETFYADNIWNYSEYLEDRIKHFEEKKNEQNKG